MNYTVISSGDLVCIIQEAEHRPEVQALCCLESDGLLNSENPCIICGSLLPISLDQSPHRLSRPVQVSWGSVTALGGGCNSVHSAPGQGHPARQWLQGLHLAEIFFFLSSVLGKTSGDSLSNGSSLVLSF